MSHRHGINGKHRTRAAESQHPEPLALSFSSPCLGAATGAQGCQAASIILSFQHLLSYPKTCTHANELRPPTRKPDSETLSGWEWLRDKPYRVPDVQPLYVDPSDIVHNVM